MISVAMATYNGEKYIREQLDSILSQSETDLEVIICDDKSSDSTVSILQEYQQKDSRIKVYVNEHNLGYLENFNKAVSLCTGDFIAFSDQDDIWLPDHIKILKENIGKNLACGGRTVRCKDNGNSLEEYSPTEYQSSKLDSNDKRFVYQCYAFNLYQGASQLISRKAVQEFFPIAKDAYAHDWLVATNAIAENSFVYVPQVITKWRKHSSQVTRKHHSRVDRKKRLQFFCNYIESTNKRIDPKDIKATILRKAIEFHTNYSIFYRIRNIFHCWKTSRVIYGRNWSGTLKTVVGYLLTAYL